MIIRYLMLFLLSLQAFQISAKVEGLDEVVAVVNGNVVLFSELNRRIEQTRMLLDSENQSYDAQQLAKQVLESLIQEKLQIELAEKKGLKLPNNAVDAHLERLAFMNQTSKETIIGSLAGKGISQATFKRDMGNQLLAAMLREQEIKNSIQVSERDIDLFLKNNPNKNNTQVTIGFLKFKKNTINSEKIQTLGEEIRQGKLPANSNWEKLATMRFDELPTIFETPAKTIAPQEVSDVIETDDAYFFIKLFEKETVTPQTFATFHNLQMLWLEDKENKAEHLKIKLLSLKNRVQKGESFSDLIKHYSEDSQTRTTGGELGWVDESKLPTLMKAQIASLKVNGISDVIPYQNGLAIIKKTGQERRDITQNVERDRARQAILQTEFDKHLADWLSELRDSAFVTIKIAELQ